jgi:hypothetical protein
MLASEQNGLCGPAPTSNAHPSLESHQGEEQINYDSNDQTLVNDELSTNEASEMPSAVEPSLYEDIVLSNKDFNEYATNPEGVPRTRHIFELNYTTSESKIILIRVIAIVKNCDELNPILASIDYENNHSVYRNSNIVYVGDKGASLPSCEIEAHTIQDRGLTYFTFNPIILCYEQIVKELEDEYPSDYQYFIYEPSIWTPYKKYDYNNHWFFSCLDEYDVRNSVPTFSIIDDQEEQKDNDSNDDDEENYDISDYTDSSDDEGYDDYDYTDRHYEGSPYQWSERIEHNTNPARIEEAIQYLPSYLKSVGKFILPAYLTYKNADEIYGYNLSYGDSLD